MACRLLLQLSYIGFIDQSRLLKAQLRRHVKVIRTRYLAGNGSELFRSALSGPQIHKATDGGCHPVLESKIS